MSKCSEALKNFRIQLYLNKSEFASKLGISKCAVGQYELGSRIPRLSILKKIRDLAKENEIPFKVEDFLC